MRILHINTKQDFGAALCARRICSSLIQQGAECRMLYGEGTSMPTGEEGAIAKKDRDILYSIPVIRKIKRMLMQWSDFYDRKKLEMMEARINESLVNKFYAMPPLTHYKNISHHPLVEWADVVHLHWVANFIDYSTFFRYVKKPIVWTPQDMYPITGMMQFSTLPKEFNDMNKIYVDIKRRGVQQASSLHMVAVSEMMQEHITSSEILAGIPVSLIHNGVDTKLFRPIGNEQSIVTAFAASLPSTTTVFMFSAFFMWDKRKGLERVLAALEKLKSSHHCNIALVVVGGDKAEQPPKASFPIICSGRVDDQHEYAKIYSAADFLISASYEEAFAQTPLEAMSCGTPVITTPCSGASDLIRPFNGVVSKGFEPDDIADAITKAMSVRYDSNAIRQYIIDNYDLSIIAKQYIALYHKICNNEDSI